MFGAIHCQQVVAEQTTFDDCAADSSTEPCGRGENWARSGQEEKTGSCCDLPHGVQLWIPHDVAPIVTNRFDLVMRNHGFHA